MEIVDGNPFAGEQGSAAGAGFWPALRLPLFSARAADPLKVIYDGDNLHVAAPNLHFLTGKPLERLKYGDVVAYVCNSNCSTKRAPSCCGRRRAASW